MKIFIWLVIVLNFIHAGYSDDIEDATLPFNSHVETIGDLGKIESIIDLRGFVPVKLLSKDSDDLQWYKVPIKEFISAIYFDNKVSWFSKKDADEDKGFLKKWKDKITNGTSKLKNKYLNVPTPIKENDVYGEEENKWIRLAYSLKRKGEELYGSVGGGYGYDDTEPIMILSTEYSSLVFMSFRYKGVKESGQYLVAFELSKTGEYKTFYRVYDTFITSVNTAQAFDDSLPIIGNIAMKLVFKGVGSKILQSAKKAYDKY